MELFVVEDDEGLSRGVAFTLEREGYKVRCFGSFWEALQAYQVKKPDAVLMDWNLPDGDGLELCRKMKEIHPVPILMVTARDMEMDEVLCLESGVDDYISKPFSLAVLKARIHSLLRRHRDAKEQERLLRSGKIRLDVERMKAFKDSEELDLSLTEYRLLRLFLENKNQVLLKEQILSRVWDQDGCFVEENTLSVNIRRLRMKIEDDPSHPGHIKTIHGMGYLWEES